MFDLNKFNSEVESKKNGILMLIKDITQTPSEDTILTLEKQIIALRLYLETEIMKLKIYENSIYYERVLRKSKEIFNLFDTENKLSETKNKIIGHDKLGITIYNFNSDSYGIESNPYDVDPNHGIIPDIKIAIKRFYDSDYEAMKTKLLVIENLTNSDINSNLIELYEYIKQLLETAIIGSDDRTLIQRKLYDNGFGKVLDYLEQAQNNLLNAKIDVDYKNSLANCRSALEEILKEIMDKDGLASNTHFSINVQDLSKKHPKLLDDANAALLQGVYNFLSLKGSHIYNDINEEIKETEFGINQTYSVISQFVDRYLSIKKS